MNCLFLRMYLNLHEVRDINFERQGDIVRYMCDNTREMAIIGREVLKVVLEN